MEGPINTSGAEDSPFISADGNVFTFFFVPDVRVPPEKQLLDGVSGIYLTRKMDGVWTEPERVVLQEPALRVRGITVISIYGTPRILAAAG
jgi:hypothetical protein